WWVRFAKNFAGDPRTARSRAPLTRAAPSSSGASRLLVQNLAQRQFTTCEYHISLSAATTCPKRRERSAKRTAHECCLNEWWLSCSTRRARRSGRCSSGRCRAQPPADAAHSPPRKEGSRARAPRKASTPAHASRKATPHSKAQRRDSTTCAYGRGSSP